jgi:metal-responsive CopG/Arc/MetJ family transcriptional regulator
VRTKPRNLTLPDEILAKLDGIRKARTLGSRSEAVRVLIREEETRIAAKPPSAVIGALKDVHGQVREQELSQIAGKLNKKARAGNR